MPPVTTATTTSPSAVRQTALRRARGGLQRGAVVEAARQLFADAGVEQSLAQIEGAPVLLRHRSHQAVNHRTVCGMDGQERLVPQLRVAPGPTPALQPCAPGIRIAVRAVVHQRSVAEEILPVHSVNPALNLAE